MEGMVSKELGTIPTHFLQLSDSRLTIDCWGVGRVTKLLECTRGQWLYRNIVVHDRASGDIATQRKGKFKWRWENNKNWVIMDYYGKTGFFLLKSN